MKMGILSINKARGMTSHDVVAVLRKKLNMKRIGHTGTLDPMATGVLPICIDKATRLAEYIVDQGKSYKACLEFGQATTTYDSTGDVTHSSDRRIFNKEEIESALLKFTGKIDQKPPIYSAVKVNGKKLYDYARSGQEVEIKSRQVTIYEIKILNLIGNKLELFIQCSKGTYIRSLIHDLGKELNTYAHMTDLVRTNVGEFTLEDSLDISKIDDFTNEDIEKMIIPVEEVLPNLQHLHIDPQLLFRLSNGQRINIRDIENSEKIDKDKDFAVFIEDKLLGIAKIKDQVLKMEKLL